MKRKPLSNSTKDEIAKLYLETDISRQELAAKFNTSLSSVQGAIKRYRLGREPERRQIEGAVNTTQTLLSPNE